MTTSAVNNAYLVLGSFNLSPFTGEIVETPGQVNTLTYSVFGGGGYEYNVPAIKHGRFDFSGYGDFTASTGISAVVNASTLGTQYGYMVAIPGTAAGDPCTIGRGIVDKNMQTFPVGQLPGVSGGLACDTAFALRGAVGAPSATYTTSGLTGTAVEMTGPTATQSMYAVLNITAASGTNLAVKVQSDDNSGFTSATDRITFSTVSATGWQWSSVAGDLSTETYWRVVATVASGTFAFSVGFGVA